MESSILLTGASGFVGQHLARVLLRRGYRVTLLDQSFDTQLPGVLDCFQADLSVASSLEALPRKWWGVIHLAAISVPGMFRTPEPVLTNLRMTMNLLDHLEEARVLLVSSCHVYAPASTPRSEDAPIEPQGRYGLSKHLCEQLVPHYLHKLDLRIARPFNHAGAGMRPELMIPSLLRRLSQSPENEHASVMMYGMNSVRDFIDVRDIATGYLAILELENPTLRTFNVCTGQGHSIEEVVQKALEILGTPRPVLFANQATSSDDVPYIVGDPSRLREYTGWRAVHTLADSLAALMQSRSEQES